ncbi:MAG: hypothetical protein IT293_05260 [Deltaproteobacteria bacterium]|nr:hypothetical protein [Deltaproteobacteria bacterium]
MTAPLIHFVMGSIGALVVFLVFARLSGVTSFSDPFGVVCFGIICASAAHFVSP